MAPIINGGHKRCLRLDFGRAGTVRVPYVDDGSLSAPWLAKPCRRRS
jgi:hypothetical protein